MAQWLWTQKQDIGPSQRMRHAMTYDSEHKLVLLFGGEANALNNDTWAWDGQVWTHVADTGPIPRALHAMTFDSVRKRTVLFGGYNGSLTGSDRYFNDTWEWDGQVWTQVADTGPRRIWHRITFDSVRQRVVLFGGHPGEGTQNLNDTWEWDGALWAQVADTGPSPRSRYAMAFDSVRQRVVLFGGQGLSLLNDTWEWDGQNWTQVADTGPSPRSDSVMEHIGTRTVLFGGVTTGAALADTWEWKDLRWTQRQNMGPPKRTAFGMAYDVQRERLVLFGGTDYSYNTKFGDTWELAIN